MGANNRKRKLDATRTSGDGLSVKMSGFSVPPLDWLDAPLFAMVKHNEAQATAAGLKRKSNKRHLS